MKKIAAILACALVLALVLGLGGAALAMTEDDIVGVWEADDYYMWYEFRDDGRWCYYYDDSDTIHGMICDGYYVISGDNAYMYTPDGSWWYTAVLDGDEIVVGDTYTAFLSSLPEFDDTNAVTRGIAGTWACEDTDSWITIYPGGTFYSYDAEAKTAFGFARVSGDTVYLVSELDDADEDAVMALQFTDDDSAVDGDQNTYVSASLPFDHHSVLDPEPGASDEAAEADDSGAEAAVSVSLDGTWEYDDFDAALEIDEDEGTFRMYNEDGLELTGRLSGPEEDGTIRLISDTESRPFTIVDDDTLTDWEGDTLTRSER